MVEKEKHTEIIEIEKERLYWISAPQPPKSKKSKALYFCIDDKLTYVPYYKDFGPLNLASVHRFCKEIGKILTKPEYSTYKIYHYTSTDFKKRANAAFLMGCYLILHMGKTPEQAWSYFENVELPFIPFRDALNGDCSYQCTILDCLNGLYYANKLGWYTPATFDIEEYTKYEEMENGDMNWIIPGKILAFSSPSQEPYDAHGLRTWTPEEYVPVFKDMGISCVIRLNKPVYDRMTFVENDIRHVDLYFTDGSTPSEEVVEEFLQVAEEEKAIAVHCQAGLGRTGTLIALYAMKHYKFPAAAFIGYIRICRPGSVLGPQQQYLIDEEEKYFRLGDEYRRKNGLSDELCLKLDALGLDRINQEKKKDYSEQDKEILRHGDIGQGEGLVERRRRK